VNHIIKQADQQENNSLLVSTPCHIFNGARVRNHVEDLGSNACCSTSLVNGPTTAMGDSLSIHQKGCPTRKSSTHARTLSSVQHYATHSAILCCLCCAVNCHMPYIHPDRPTRTPGGTTPLLCVLLGFTSGWAHPAYHLPTKGAGQQARAGFMHIITPQMNTMPLNWRSCAAAAALRVATSQLYNQQPPTNQTATSTHARCSD
jgi:hypothetical protein